MRARTITHIPVGHAIGAAQGGPNNYTREAVKGQLTLVWYPMGVRKLVDAAPMTINMKGL